MCRCTIDADDAAASFPFYGIGVKTISVCDIVNVNLLILNDIYSVHQDFVNGDAADIVQIRLCYRCTVDFRFHYFDIHLNKFSNCQLNELDLIARRRKCAHVHSHSSS